MPQLNSNKRGRPNFGSTKKAAAKWTSSSKYVMDDEILQLYNDVPDYSAEDELLRFEENTAPQSTSNPTLPDISMPFKLTNSAFNVKNHSALMSNEIGLDLDLEESVSHHMEHTLFDDAVLDPLDSASVQLFDYETDTRLLLEDIPDLNDFMPHDPQLQQKYSPTAPMAMPIEEPKKTVVKFRKFQGVNPYKSWILYFPGRTSSTPSSLMTEADYEWCCILEQYLDDEQEATSSLLGDDELRIIRSGKVCFNLDKFINGYCRNFEFIFQGQDGMRDEALWKKGLLEKFSRLALTVITDKIHRTILQEQELANGGIVPENIPLAKLLLNTLYTANNWNAAVSLKYHQLDEVVHVVGRITKMGQSITCSEFAWICLLCQKTTNTSSFQERKKGCLHCAGGSKSGLKLNKATGSDPGDNVLKLCQSNSLSQCHWNLQLEGSLIVKNVPLFKFGSFKVKDCVSITGVVKNSVSFVENFPRVTECKSSNATSSLLPDKTTTNRKDIDHPFEPPLFLNCLGAYLVENESPSDRRMFSSDDRRMFSSDDQFLFEKLSLSFCHSLNGRHLTKALLLLVTLSGYPFSILLIGDPPRTLMEAFIREIKEYRSDDMKIIWDFQNVVQTGGALKTLKDNESTFLVCQATPIQGHFNHGKSLSENLGFPSTTDGPLFLTEFFDLIFYLKDDPSDVYGDLLLSEYVLSSVHGGSVTSIQKDKFKGTEIRTKGKLTTLERLVTAEQQEVAAMFRLEDKSHFYKQFSGRLQELRGGAEKAFLSQEETKLLLNSSSLYTKFSCRNILWISKLLKTYCLLRPGSWDVSVKDIFVIEDLLSYYFDQLASISAGESLALTGEMPGSSRPKPVPKGKSGQLKMLIASLHPGSIVSDLDLLSLAQTLGLAIVVDNWDATLDSLNQQGILLKTGANSFKVL